MEATSRIKIVGMTCAACSGRVEKKLNSTVGVEKANVNLTLEEATIKYDSQKISYNELSNTIEALGYSVIKRQSSKKDEQIGRAHV